jgi:hypothetical protein
LALGHYIYVIYGLQQVTELVTGELLVIDNYGGKGHSGFSPFSV